MVPSKNRLPVGSYYFEVHPQMTEEDIKQYLEKIYKVDVRHVRAINKAGEFIQSPEGPHRIRRERDSKFAVIAIRGEEAFQLPKLDYFLDEDEKDGEKKEGSGSSLRKQVKQIQDAAKEDKRKNWLKQDIPSWFHV